LEASGLGSNPRGGAIGVEEDLSAVSSYRAGGW
jgi:hypothetical protein